MEHGLSAKIDPKKCNSIVTISKTFYKMSILGNYLVLVSIYAIILLGIYSHYKIPLLNV